jgi:cell division protein FtsB
MIALIMVAVVVMVILGGLFTSIGAMNPFSMVVAIVAIAVFGGVLREFAKGRRDASSTAQKDLAEIKERIAQIEADIADIKEQIADFIIKQV